MPAIDFCGVDCEMFINCKRYFLSYSIIVWFLSSNEIIRAEVLPLYYNISREGNPERGIFHKRRKSILFGHKTLFNNL